MTQGTTSAVFAYDADGFRTLKTVGGITTNFVTDKNRDYAQVVAEVEGGVTKATYTYGNDLINQTKGGATSYYLYDALGSTRALSDASGVVTDTYSYSAFGKDLNHTGTTANSYKFAGEQYDSALDNYYLRARYYNQNVGRFTQMDTYAGSGSDPITLHKYLYANADGVNGRDPSGRFTLSEFSTEQFITGVLLGAASFEAGEMAGHLAFGNRPTHYYETNRIQICSASPRCTPNNIYKLMLRMPATAHGDPDLGHDVEDGEKMYAGWWVFPGGQVRVTRIDGQYKHVNTTTLLHTLYEGTITRQAINGMGGVTISTVGEGKNYTYILAMLNAVVGKAAFEDLDRIIKEKYDEGSGW